MDCDFSVEASTCCLQNMVGKTGMWFCYMGDVVVWFDECPDRAFDVSETKCYSGTNVINGPFQEKGH